MAHPYHHSLSRVKKRDGWRWTVQSAVAAGCGLRRHFLADSAGRQLRQTGKQLEQVQREKQLLENENARLRERIRDARIAKAIGDEYVPGRVPSDVVGRSKRSVGLPAPSPFTGRAGTLTFSAFRPSSMRRRPSVIPPKFSMAREVI
jgi:hypothetical protein